MGREIKKQQNSGKWGMKNFWLAFGVGIISLVLFFGVVGNVWGQTQPQQDAKDAYKKAYDALNAAVKFSDFSETNGRFNKPNNIEGLRNKKSNYDTAVKNYKDAFGEYPSNIENDEAKIASKILNAADKNDPNLVKEVQKDIEANGRGVLLKTALEQDKFRLENEINDLEKRIANGEDKDGSLQKELDQKKQFLKNTQNSIDRKEAEESGGLSNILKFFGFDLPGLFFWINGAIWEFLILPALGFIMGISGTILDLSINYSIDAGNMLSKSMDSISVGWTILRDTANIIFIFALLYISISTILRVGSYWGKKILTNVLIAALLVNFSLITTKVIIDFGNAAAVGVYNQIELIVEPSSGKITGGLSNFIKNSLNATEQYTKIFDLLEGKKSLADGTVKFLTAVSRAIIMIAITVIFLLSAFLFIGRLVSFYFLLMLSPIGFIGHLIPQISDYSKKWWKELINNTISAPIFLIFMLLIVLLLKNGLITAGAENSAINLTDLTTLKAMIAEFVRGSINMMLPLIVVLFMFIYAYKATKALSGEIGNVATVLGAGTVALGVGLLSGGAATAGRLLVGGAASGLANRKAGQSVLASMGSGIAGRYKERRQAFVDKWSAAKIKERALKAASEGTYNPLRVTSKILGGDTVGEAFKKYSGIDVKMPKSPSEIAREKRKEAEEKKEDANQKELKMNERKLDEIIKSNKTSVQKETEIADILRSMSDKNVTALDEKILKDPTLIKKMSGSQVGAVMKDDNVKKEVKDEVTYHRNIDLVTAAGGGITLVGKNIPVAPINSAVVKREMAKMNAESVAKLGTNILSMTEIINNLKPQHLAAMKDADDNLRQTIVGGIRTVGISHPSHNYITNGAGRDLWQ